MAIHIMLSRIEGKTCLVYWDDMIVFSKDLKEHRVHLQEILELLAGPLFRSTRFTAATTPRVHIQASACGAKTPPRTRPRRNESRLKHTCAATSTPPARSDVGGASVRRPPI